MQRIIYHYQLGHGQQETSVSPLSDVSGNLELDGAGLQKPIPLHQQNLEKIVHRLVQTLVAEPGCYNQSMQAERGMILLEVADMQQRWQHHLWKIAAVLLSLIYHREENGVLHVRMDRFSRPTK